MEKDVNIFDFQGNSVREINIDGEPWFVGKDVTKILGYKNTRDALAKHVDTEDKKVDLINESGVYSLIFSSTLPNDKKFKHWLTYEVLPSIRRTGKYKAPQCFAEALRLAAIRRNQNKEKSL